MTTPTQMMKPAKPGTPTIRDRIESPEFRSAVSKALPKHLTPDRFLRTALTAMTRTPKLADCDQSSFFSALLSLSQMGLEPDGRNAHLIPFENRRRGCVEVQLIVDYKGLVELAMRSGQISNIHADVVCDADAFDYDRGELKTHKINFRQPRGDMYAAYALARFRDGGEKVEVMTLEEILAIRDRSRAKDSGPWVTDFREMAKKTVFRRLSKWLPLSPEFRDALDADADAAEETRFAAANPVPAGAFHVITNGETPAAKVEAPNDDPPDLKPAPRATTPAAATEAATETPAAATILTAQEELCKIVIGEGFTFDHFLAWADGSGMVDSKTIETLTAFDDVPLDVARRCIKAKVGLLKGLELAKAGAK